MKSNRRGMLWPRPDTTPPIPAAARGPTPPAGGPGSGWRRSGEGGSAADRAPMTSTADPCVVSATAPASAGAVDTPRRDGVGIGTNWAAAYPTTTSANTEPGHQITAEAIPAMEVAASAARRERSGTDGSLSHQGLDDRSTLVV